MTVIEFYNVTKSYRSRTVLEDIQFSIKENTLTGIIGRNGVGKTTLMKMIAGFSTVNNGEIEVFSETPFNNLKVSSNLIFVDDVMPFPPHMTLKDILNECRNFFHRWDHDFALRLLKHFGLYLGLKPRMLSKGKNSTFNAIVGLASRSPITIFDEPTTGMDAVVRKDFYRALLKDYLAHPRTILLSSHHVEEIEHLLEDVLLIHDKKILFHDAITVLQETFIELTGKEEALFTHIQEQDIISRKETGSYVHLTVENHFSEEAFTAMQRDQIKVSAISANDAYIALTQRTKGGIDDVFA